MPDVDKLFEKAEKYLQKQKFESALETYQEIFKYEPKDEEVLVNLGDLSLKLNRTAEGLRYQAQLAEFYAQRNDIAKAVATYRKILKLSAQDLNILMKLAGLLEKSQKTSEALETYREALQMHRRAGANALVMDCLEHIVKLDPANMEANIELGELAGNRQPKVAGPAFLRAAQLALQAGDENRWGELVDRAYAVEPNNQVICVAAAEVRLKRDRGAEAVALLEPVYETKPDDLQVVELLAQAYLQTGDNVKAQPLSWRAYQGRPDAIELVQKVAEGFVQAGDSEKALAVAAQLRGALYKQGKRNEYLQIVEKIYAADESNLQVLETLSGLYNEMNREDGLRRSLVRLFNLYVAAEQYDKAADTLEKIIDVDPYGEGHYDRLLNLEGYIDKTWYGNIASRLQPPSGRAAPGAPTAAGGMTPSKAESLDDLIIEGEMFQQYQLTAKLAATLERINHLFPGAEEENPRLRDLYNAAGFHPAPAPMVKPAPEAKSHPARPPEAPAAATAAAAALQSLDDLRKISEITANIYREGTPQNVMQVAVNEIGRTLNASRCWGALGTSDRPAALWAEYCSPASSASDPAAAARLFTTLMGQAKAKPDGWSMENAAQFPVLAPISSDIQKLGIQSLLALPLMDKEQATGLLLVEQCDMQRTWSAGEIVLLNAISTQVVIAVSNTKLRRLVRSLSGTDDETGLMPRSSYVDCMLSEASRAKNQSQPFSVCLLEPENPSAVVKAMGDAGLQRYLKQVAKALQSNMRQNDIAIRYNPCSIAVLFPDTALPQGGLAVEKFRRAIGQIKPDGGNSPNFCSAVCEVQLSNNFDVVDGVTEVINRLESVLEQSRKEGGKRVLLSKFES
jgi:tetratricopeptide (TPR) repeat protein/GGDEF domain-containing protein